MASRSTDAERRTRTSDEEGTSKPIRARVSRACTRCRARKDKCDAKQPSCTNCANAGQSCVYVAGTKRRGLQEGYVRGLEKLWAVMLQKVHGLDDAVQQVVRRNEQELLRIWNHQKLGDGLHTTWKESNVLTELEKLLSHLEHSSSIHPKRKRDIEDDGEDEAAEPLHHRSRGDKYVLTSDFKVVEMAQIPNEEETGPGFGDPLTEGKLGITRPEEVPLPSSASRLLDQYFTFTHCWFPILDRPATLRKFFEHTMPHKRRPLDHADLSCIWAILAYSQQQTGHLLPTPAATPGTSVAELRSLARNLIPSERGPFSLGHVQALLLLVLLDIGMGDWTSAWMLVGSAIRALLISKGPEAVVPFENPRGLYSDSRIDRDDGTTASRHILDSKHRSWQALLQGCFVLDTIIAICLKRPPHLRSGHLSSTQFLEEDGHEEWEPWKAVAGDDGPESREPAFVTSCFNRLTELCMIANDAFCTKVSHATMITPTQHVVSRLRSLGEKYPFTLSDVIRRPPHQMLLHACHFAFQTANSQWNGDQPELKSKLAEVLRLFDHSWNLPNKCGIPSMLIPLYCLANLETDTSSSPINGPHLVPERPNLVRSRLALIWPGAECFMNGGTPMRSTGLLSTAPVLPFNNALQTQPASANIAPASSSHRDLGRLQDFEHEPTLLRYHDMAQYGNAIEVPQPNASTAADYVDYGAMSVDMPEENNEASVGLNSMTKTPKVSGLSTSPSFNGDEIDALFHEMAQLDTTRWTDDRTQGLKDFGFPDDTTFEAFCNDPDRLMGSDGFMGVINNESNLLSEDQAATSGNDNLRIGKMTFDDIFR
ncbi:hypothetical protein AYO21_07229 [Fonsecaea monophora]|uniref:Zn(2)-C6 fungal-type domain-containing protein n=1 Tax=Fonsecaea monophora TaxID=254056 RepID=A0A177F5K9_9EURO|nr:hypothetical protein AYO21_07229 [Fonsecaea monophora]KAH0843496.1 hypothetical protein FOPE_08528 [Fonsecaea pedrosoi]OAG38569.1 hypothetical protein AYO21_07229 [Fonsecaea monophora]